MKRRCSVCGKLTEKWQRVNGGQTHCYDGCVSAVSEGVAEVAERCEKAAGRDFALEQEIARAALGWRDTGPAAPPFTASIDAAITLVPPERLVGRLCQEVSYWYCYLIAFDREPAKGHGKTAALALCAASLRAIAASATRQGDAHD